MNRRKERIMSILPTIAVLAIIAVAAVEAVVYIAMKGDKPAARRAIPE